MAADLPGAVVNGAWVEFDGVVKPYGGAAPLTVTRLSIGPGDRLVLTGLDAGAAEMFTHLLTGAALPESGAISVFGQDTRAIRTDTEWLTSLDRFGLVSNRAVLLDQSSIAANLALPFTLAIDPMPDDVRASVAALAEEVGLAAGRLDAPAGTMTPPERMRAHLARALANRPSLLLLEHPTVTLEPGDREAFGRAVRAVSAARDLAWVAISNDEVFARASGGRTRVVHPAMPRAGRIAGVWRRWFTS